MQKILVLVSADAIEKLSMHYLTAGTVTHWSMIDEKHSIAAIFPRHLHARFALAEEDGITVLPGHHDPAPIGPAIAAALTHVKAKPTETMRAIALRLHAAHGPAFHPDT